MSRPVKPNLADMLAAVQPGNTVRLTLSPKQKRALADTDGQIALDVLRHHLGARASSVQPGRPREQFPLTADTFAAIARKLDMTVGIKRARTMIHRLRATNVLESSGSYPQKHGSRYRVALYRLAALIAPPRRKRPVGRRRPVKRWEPVRWWQTPFGDASGRPPPGLTMAQARRMRSLDELEWARE